MTKTIAKCAKTAAFCQMLWTYNHVIVISIKVINSADGEAFPFLFFDRKASPSARIPSKTLDFSLKSNIAQITCRSSDHLQQQHLCYLLLGLSKTLSSILKETPYSSINVSYPSVDCWSKNDKYAINIILNVGGTQ